MATNVTPVSQQQPWTLMGVTADYMDMTGDPSDPKTYNHTTAITNWASSFSPNANQRARIDLATIEANTLLLKFYGDPASPASGAGTGTVRVGQGAVWGVSKLIETQTTEYLGDYLGKFWLVVGNDTVGTSGILPDGTPDAVWVREIQILEDRSLFPAMRVVGQQGDAAAVLAIDSMGYSHVIVELRCEAPGGYTPPLPDLSVDAPDDLALLYRVL